MPTSVLGNSSLNMISLGIYNFTTHLNGVKYLVKKPNTLDDVQHIVKSANVQKTVKKSVYFYCKMNRYAV